MKWWRLHLALGRLYPFLCRVAARAALLACNWRANPSQPELRLSVSLARCSSKLRLLAFRRLRRAGRIINWALLAEVRRSGRRKILWLAPGEFIA